MEQEKVELTDVQIEQRTGAVDNLIQAQKDRLTKGLMDPYSGAMTLLALETIRKTIKEDVTMILPTKKFADKFTRSIAMFFGILQVPLVKVNEQTIWVWGRSRLSLTSPAYYKVNKQKFWGTHVHEIKL